MFGLFKKKEKSGNNEINKRTDITISLYGAVGTKYFYNPFKRCTVASQNPYIIEFSVDIDDVERLIRDVPIEIKNYTQNRYIKSTIIVGTDDYINHYEKGFYAEFRRKAGELIEILRDLDKDTYLYYNELYGVAMDIVYNAFLDGKIEDEEIQESSLELLYTILEDIENRKSDDKKNVNNSIQEELEFIKRFRANKDKNIWEEFDIDGTSTGIPR